MTSNAGIKDVRQEGIGVNLFLRTGCLVRGVKLGQRWREMASQLLGDVMGS